MNRVVPRLVAILALLQILPCGPSAAPALAPTTGELLNARLDLAERATQRRAFKDAIAAATGVIEQDPKNARAYQIRGSVFEATNDHEKAVADFTELIRLAPGTTVYQHRGTEYFKLGRVKEAIADFDKMLELAPAQAPYHWQRGIALYYAGLFEDGRRQFELHQTVNASDVENAVWHFLCVARGTSLEKAREALIPIQGDARIPMAQIHALFAGKGDAAGVLAAANAGKPSAEQLRDRLFYAHLYLALYEEAQRNAAKVEEHLQLATTAYAQSHYMGDVARVHLKVLKGSRK